MKEKIYLKLFKTLKIDLIYNLKIGILLHKF